MQKLHEKVLSKLLEYRKIHTDFTFYTRRRNRSQRLENGYWFLGNESYINVPLFNVGDSDNNTQTIGFVYEIEHNRCFIEIVYKNVIGITEAEYNFYQELVDFLPYKEQQANQNRYWYIFKNNDMFQNLDYYIKDFRNKCIELINKYNLEEKYLITEAQFNQYLDKINEYKNQKVLTRNDILMVMKEFTEKSIDGQEAEKHYFQINDDSTLYPRKYIVKTARNYLGLDNENFTTEQAKQILDRLFEHEIQHINTDKNQINDAIENFIQSLEFNQDNTPEVGLKLETIAQKRIFYVYTNNNQNIMTKPLDGDRQFSQPKTAIERYIRTNEIHPDNDSSYIKPIGNYIKENYIKESIEPLPLITPKNKILYGPPGTGKTYKLQELQKQYENRFVTVTFHQSYGYEEFVEGLKAKIDDDDNVYYKVEAGIFKDICEKAKNDKNNQYAIFIDEINRGNISKIFGALITLIEISKRETIFIVLPYSKKTFTVPKNLSIIGTMNTADRSIALLDTALRRRFDFIEMMPICTHHDILTNIDGINVQEVLKTINERIEFLYDRDHTIGHAYFIDCNDFEGLKNIFKNKIIPLLEEYFYDDWEKINLVLNNNGFIKSKTYKQKTLFSNCNFEEFDDDKIIYHLNDDALSIADNYIKIYE